MDLQTPLATIGSYGLLGALFLIALATIWWLTQKLFKSYETNSESWKEISDIVTNNAVMIEKFTSSNDARTRALESLVRSHEVSNEADKALLELVRGNSSLLVDLNREFQRVKEGLIKKGVPL